MSTKEELNDISNEILSMMNELEIIAVYVHDNLFGLDSSDCWNCIEIIRANYQDCRNKLAVIKPAGTK